VARKEKKRKEKEKAKPVGDDNGGLCMETVAARDYHVAKLIGV